MKYLVCKINIASAKTKTHKPNEIPLDVLENFETCSPLSCCAIRYLCTGIRTSKIITVKPVTLLSNTLITR